MTLDDDNLDILDQFHIGWKKFTLVTDGHYFAILEDDANPNDCDGALITASEEYVLDQWEKAMEGHLNLWSYDQQEVHPTVS